MLATLTVLAALAHLLDAERYASPLFHCWPAPPSWAPVYRHRPGHRAQRRAAGCGLAPALAR